MLVRYLSTILGYGKGLLQFAVEMCKCGKLGPQPGRLLEMVEPLGSWVTGVLSLRRMQGAQLLPGSLLRGHHRLAHLFCFQ